MATISRKEIFIRLIFTVLYLFILGMVMGIAKLAIFCQFIYLFATGNINSTLQSFTNKVSVYAYKIFRYVTFCEDQKPFPFSDFPDELEEPEPYNVPV